MFGFGKSKTKKAIEALKNQGIGGQSVLYSLFIKALEVSPDCLRKIELTYFSLSALTYVFLRFYQGSEKEKILDEAAISIIKASMPSCGENISMKQAVAEYKQRYREYEALLRPLFTKAEPDPNITLLMHFYERVTQDSSTGTMIQIAAASPLINQYVIDNIDFVKNEMQT
ncbi:MAG: hypothetical protein R3B74_10290 [Nitrospirales bacterium]|nr:hypothetical protein [Nitrospirales bacterium]